MPSLNSATRHHRFISQKALSYNPKTRRLSAVICTRDLDRQGDVVEPGGLDFGNFMLNPVLLWNHDMGQPPVGKVIELQRTGEVVEAVIEFADTPFAREVAQLYAGGYLNTFSIGFLPKKFRRLEEADFRDLGISLKDRGKPGFFIEQAELVEVSVVPVPANPQALAKALDCAKEEVLRKALQEQLPAAGDDQPEEQELQPLGFETRVSVKEILALPEDLPLAAFRKTFEHRARAKFPVEFRPAPATGAEIILKYQKGCPKGGAADGADLEARLTGIVLAVLPADTTAPKADGLGGRQDMGEDAGKVEGGARIDPLDLHCVETELADAQGRAVEIMGKCIDIQNQGR